MRNLLKGLAAEGHTVFVSSHLMSEMALTADHLVVIGRGRLIADTTRRGVHRARSATAPSPSARRRPRSCVTRCSRPGVSVTSDDAREVLTVDGPDRGTDRHRRLAGRSCPSSS